LKQKVCVVGLGYIGLPTAALLAGQGHEVCGVDISLHAVETINSGRIHIVEPDLDAYVHSAVAQGRLRAFTAPQPADVFMICVPTPFHQGGDIPLPNVDYVLAATRSIAGCVQAGNLVILESTSPVGTTQLVSDELRKMGVEMGAVHVAYCPERVLPGKIMTELVENDRVVGGLTPDATRVVADFYRSFVKGDVLETDAACAEMCKLTENSFRDVNIAFANELSLICDKIGVDVWELIRLANRHPRVSILQPGPGVGGHCIAVDPWFIVSKTPELARLIRTAREVNDGKPQWVLEKVRRAASECLADRPGKTAQDISIACFGLAFKPDIDDLRESPSLEIAYTIAQTHPGGVYVVEPHIRELPEVLAGTKAELMDADLALAQADVAVLLVDHKVFKNIMLEHKADTRMVDTRGIWKRQ
jgi:UDP-N-acetyl-D-mannosaminuronic acid dehydrogenase